MGIRYSSIARSLEIQQREEEGEFQAQKAFLTAQYPTIRQVKEEEFTLKTEDPTSLIAQYHGIPLLEVREEASAVVETLKIV